MKMNIKNIIEDSELGTATREIETELSNDITTYDTKKNWIIKAKKFKERYVNKKGSNVKSI